MFLNIFIDDISRIDEQNSSIRIKGTIKAEWHPQKSIENIYVNDDDLMQEKRDDFLQEIADCLGIYKNSKSNLEWAQEIINNWKIHCHSSLKFNFK